MRIWTMSAVAAGVIAACAAPEMPLPPEGAALYAKNCALCHGPAGRGDGPMAAGLSPAPADLTRIAARAGGEFPRADVLSTIDGYTRMDMDQAQDMPEFGLLLRGETVPVDVGDGQFTPVPRPLAALLVYLESIQEG
ncbi:MULTISPECIES: c-type cytochrome [Sediminimonas]|uniref:Cytochrome c n=1 Tax=Sediminimonas qiaohouensis TaxID=552061 RepID=A0A7C9HC86_9RHOB|nr:MULTISPECIES: cytochrome c [Sediminimonas]MDR9486304.1 cytochrome c [Sediminimonas sp.]MTJ05946.1 cytochrome c [Sediminimonas qiaohouensis]